MLPSGVLTAILDSCFSGGMLKIIADPSGAGADVEVARTKAWTGPSLDGDQKAIAPAEQSIVRVKRFGMAPVYGTSSTDSNLPMSLGIPAVTIGRGGPGGRSHSPDEWTDVAPAAVARATQVGLAVVVALAGGS